MSRLPAGASRAWAKGMTAATPLYDRLNFAGGVVGGRLFTEAHLGRQMAAVTAKILHDVAFEGEPKSPGDEQRDQHQPRGEGELQIADRLGTHR
ncbi:MAG: hypothetical protein ACOH16_10900 [Propionibacteriaceae bacterium]